MLEREGKSSNDLQNARRRKCCATIGSRRNRSELVVFELTALDPRVAYEWFGSRTDEHVSLCAVGYLRIIAPLALFAVTTNSQFVRNGRHSVGRSLGLGFVETIQSSMIVFFFFYKRSKIQQWVLLLEMFILYNSDTRVLLRSLGGLL